MDASSNAARGRSQHVALPRALVPLTAAVLFLWLQPGCLVEMPQVPQFTTRLQVPIGQERITGVDLADSLGPLIHADSAGTGPLELRFGGSLGRVELGRLLALDVPPLNARGVLAQIALDAPYADTVRFRPGEVLPFPVGSEGLLAQIDPFLFSIGPIDMGVIEDFVRVEIASGELRFSLTNRLPVTLSGPSSSGHSLRIVLRDISRNPARTIGVWVIDRPLAPGQTAGAALDLAGQALGNHFAVMIQGGSPGSGGETIMIRPADGLDLFLALSDLRVSYLEAPARPQRFEVRGTLDLSPVAALDWAEVERGHLAWRLTSSLPVAAVARVELPGLIVASTGLPLAAQVRVDPRATRRVVLDLGGERLEAWGDGPLDWQISVETEATEGIVSLSSQDGIMAALEPAAIELRAVAGVLQATELVVAPVRIAVEVPAEVDSAAFQAATLAIDLYNASAAGGIADLTVVGRAAQRQVVLPMRIDIPAGSAGRPAHTRLELNEANSSILELIDLRPDSVAVGGMLLVGDGETTMGLRADDCVEGRYEVVAPLRFVLPATSHTGEPFELELAQNVRERIGGHLDALVLEAEIENHFPVSAEVEVHFALAAENLLVADDLVLRTGWVAAGEVDPLSGRVTASRVTSVSLAVVAGEIHLFTAERLHGAIVVHLLGGQHPVEFSGADYLQFQGVATLEVGVR